METRMLWCMYAALGLKLLGQPLLSEEKDMFLPKAGVCCGEIPHTDTKPPAKVPAPSLKQKRREPQECERIPTS